MATRRLSGLTTSSSVPDNGGDHSGGGGSPAKYVDDVFSTYVYTGDGQDRDIVNGIDLAGEGGMVWTKARTMDWSHGLVDTERGASTGIAPGKTLKADRPDSAGVQMDVTSFNTSGYTIGSDHFVNKAGEDYTSWTFRKAPKFFDVVTFSGDNATGRQIPHNLGAVPGMIMLKATNAENHWRVYHNSIGATYELWLNESNAKVLNGTFDNTDPTDKHFTVGSLPPSYEYVAYVFAHDDSDESMIKCGTFSGQNPLGTEVDLGWEPQWVLIKEATGVGPWYIFDSQRGVVTGGDDAYLQANEAFAEAAMGVIEFTATGFKASFSSNPATDYIFMAIRRPNKPASEFEPEELFAMDDYLGTNPVEKLVPSGFPVDMSMIKNYEATDRRMLFTRLLGDDTYLRPDATDPSTAITGFRSDANEGVYVNGTTGNLNATVQRNIAHMWRRASGFFDVVAYEGDGVAGREVPHGLAVAPEMMWVFCRSTGRNINVYVRSLGPTGALLLNTEAKNTGLDFSSTFWGGINPTDAVFTVDGSFGVNGTSNDYVSYLFASAPGICDIGSYTATNVNEDIDCGFTNGARFVLIKRTDASGDWMYWDAERGINIFSQKSPMLKLNETDAQVLNGYIMPFSGGFRVNSGDPAAIDGGSYIYMAIA